MHAHATLTRRTALGGLVAAGTSVGLAGCTTSDDSSTTAASQPGTSAAAASPTTSTSANASVSTSASTGSASATNAVVVDEHDFTSAGNRIFGQLRRPAGAGRHPAVILSHGFGGNHDQESHLQELLAQHGVAVYSFDFAGGTGYEPGRSQGSMTDMSVLTEVQNLRDALTLVKGLDAVDPDHITLIGCSQGGVVTTLVAEQNPAGVHHIVLLYPAFSLFDDARKRYPSAADVPATVDLMGLTVGRRYFTDILDIDIYQHMAAYKGTVTIFHGTADNLVPVSYSQRAAKTFAHATLTTLPGEGHGFSTSAQERVATAILPIVTA